MRKRHYSAFLFVIFGLHSMYGLADPKHDQQFQIAQTQYNSGNYADGCPGLLAYKNRDAKFLDSNKDVAQQLDGALRNCARVMNWGTPTRTRTAKGEANVD